MCASTAGGACMATAHTCGARTAVKVGDSARTDAASGRRTCWLRATAAGPAARRRPSRQESWRGDCGVTAPVSEQRRRATRRACTVAWAAAVLCLACEAAPAVASGRSSTVVKEDGVWYDDPMVVALLVVAAGLLLCSCTYAACRRAHSAGILKVFLARLLRRKAANPTVPDVVDVYNVRGYGALQGRLGLFVGAAVYSAPASSALSRRR